MRRALLVLFALVALAAPAAADVFKPAYLNLREVAPETYDILWKLPAIDENRMLDVQPVFPAEAEEITAPSSSYASGASVVRWRMRIPGGIEGHAVGFTNLSRTGGDVLVRYERGDGTEQVGRVLPVDPRFTFTASPGPFEVVFTYTWIGVEHILLGVDHLLFVLALVLIVQGVRRLLWTITAFTLAHSITLVLATLDVVQLPGPPVEAIIALSIVFVAGEILHLQQGKQSLAARKPWLVAFAFGLLHGLGFAGALAEVGLPQNAVPLALLFFNVGVELGQVAFVAAILLLVALARFAARQVGGAQEFALTRTVVVYGIGGVASYWVIERVAGFVA